MFHALVRLGALAVGLSAAAPLHAQDFPSRPITVIVGLAPGGITDITARLYAETVSKNIGQRVVVENRQGAGGAIGAAAVQNAAPDGYTLLVFSGSQHAAVPAMQQAPYDPVRGFDAVTLLFNIVTFIAVPPDSPANSLKELFELGKKKSGGLLFGSPGSGTPSHLLAAKLGHATQTPMQFVHYRGGAPMMADLITGRVDFALPSYTVARSFLAEKKLKVLAIDSVKRVAALPDVPTLTELGFGKEKVASWFALAAPAATPPAIVAKLNAEFIKASRDPELVKRLEENGTPIVVSTPADMTKLMADEWASTGQLVRDIGLKAP